MDSKVKRLHSRANCLAAEFKQGRQRKPIDGAIFLDREALELCPPGHPRRSYTLTLLSSHLSDRYGQFGEMMDLECSIIYAREALELCPAGNADRSICLNNLGLYLSDRYMQLGAVVDLDKAIILAQDALALCPSGHSARSIRLNNLGLYLSLRYKLLGETADLNEATVLAQEALSLCPPGHTARSARLSGLGNRLSERYKRLGAIVDLNESISLARDALALCQPSDRLACLNNLGNRLSDRYKELGSLSDVNEAIGLARELLAGCPEGNPARPMYLNNLANHLSHWYRQSKAIEDIDEAISLARGALALCPLGHPDRLIRLNNLANSLSDRFRELNVTEDIDEAILLARDGLSLYPPGRTGRSQSLDNLAFHLLARFTQSKQSKDVEEVFDLYSQVSQISSDVSSADISAAHAWIQAAEDFQNPTVLSAYESTLRLTIHHLATLPPLPSHLGVFKGLTSSLAVDAFSACLRNQAPKMAIELLEQGRGMFWSQLARLRCPLDDLVASGLTGRTLADKFSQLSSNIRHALNTPGADQHDRVYRLMVELEGVAVSIRELPGLSRFLLPLVFQDLQQAASGGPVIIVNASKYTCDALIVMLDREPIHIPLKIARDRVRDISSDLYTLTKRGRLKNTERQFAALLQELWAEVVSPIVDVLQTTCPRQSRIWWCPTAEFTPIPLHAAGWHMKGKQKLNDLYISSYTPTLTALIRSRRQVSSNSGLKKPNFVAIGLVKAAGETKQNDELTDIGQHIGNPAAFKIVDGRDSHISRVEDEFHKNGWIHLACRGVSNRKQPFESAFALHGGHFTIERMMRFELPEARFAYLSVCHTTAGDEECPDEMIHLASVMQFVGFRSIIGITGVVGDGHKKKIASKFYENMVNGSGHLDYTRAAFALHKTIQTVDVPLNQRNLYMHLGA